jgi:hypothetical protein
MKASRQPSAFRVLFFCVIPLLAVGCASVPEKQVIQQPRPNANVQIFQRDKHADLLVLYNEEHPRTGKIERRAYFLEANEPKIRNNKKPRFVPVELSNGMQPLPLEKPATNTAGVVWVEPSPDGRRFTLCYGGPLEGRYTGETHLLPAYPNLRGEAKQVLISSADVTFETAKVVGSTAFFLGFFWLYAGLPGIHL